MKHRPPVWEHLSPVTDVVSGILTGKRNLNLRQVRALAQLFAVSPATFV